MKKVKRLDVGDWVQAIGITGVIAGLILVAYELRQNSQIARAEMNVQQYVQMQSIHSAFRDREFSSVFQKMLEQPDSLSPDEVLMIDGHFRDLISLLLLEKTMIERGIFVDTLEFWGDYVVQHGLGTEFGRIWWSQNMQFMGRNRIPIDEALDRFDEGKFKLEYMP
jgi:hypothetical protein